MKTTRKNPWDQAFQKIDSLVKREIKKNSWLEKANPLQVMEFKKDRLRFHLAQALILIDEYEANIDALEYSASRLHEVCDA
jgi:hypothetical protein